jgi:hypothetical protein
LTPKPLPLSMILPGLVSVAFYRRRPSPVQIALGIVVTVVLSAIIGYVSPPGPLGSVAASVVVAIGGGLLLYVAILAYLLYVYQPGRRAAASAPPDPPA